MQIGEALPLLGEIGKKLGFFLLVTRLCLVMQIGEAQPPFGEKPSFFSIHAPKTDIPQIFIPHSHS